MKDEHAALRNLMKENNRLLIENNEMLKVMRRNARLAFVFRVIWICVLIVIPFVLYHYLHPYLSALSPLFGDGASSKEFWSGLINFGGI